MCRGIGARHVAQNAIRGEHEGYRLACRIRAADQWTDNGYKCLGTRLTICVAIGQHRHSTRRSRAAERWAKRGEDVVLRRRPDPKLTDSSIVERAADSDTTRQ